ncbi:MAG: GGDEF domain-containing protein [Succinivibrionaceae bacterium]|nr:GGDEF domain-containing protein [Succinivibrionaceae bacterium]
MNWHYLASSEHLCCCLLCLAMHFLLRSQFNRDVSYHRSVTLTTAAFCAVGALMHFLLARALDRSVALGDPSADLAAALICAYYCMALILPFSCFIGGWRLFFPQSRNVLALNALLCAPLALGLALVLTTSLTGLCYSLSRTEVIVGPLFAVLPGIFFLYMAATMVLPLLGIMAYGSSLNVGSHRDAQVISVAVLLPTVAGVLDLAFALPVIAPSFAVALLYMLTDFQRRRISRDQLTGLYNRRELTLRMPAYLGRRGRRLHALCLCVSGYGLLCQKLGQHEGDMMLLRFCALLRAAAPSSCFMARCGEGEFVLLIERGGAVLGEDVVVTLRKMVSDYNIGSDKPYQLDFVHDCAKVEGEFRHGEDLVAFIDARLAALSDLAEARALRASRRILFTDLG